MRTNYWFEIKINSSPGGSCKRKTRPAERTQNQTAGSSGWLASQPWTKRIQESRIKRVKHPLGMQTQTTVVLVIRNEEGTVRGRVTPHSAVDWHCYPSTGSNRVNTPYAPFTWIWLQPQCANACKTWPQTWPNSCLQSVQRIEMFNTAFSQQYIVASVHECHAAYSNVFLLSLLQCQHCSGLCL